MMRYIYLIILGLFFSVINMEANNSASISLVPCPTNVVPGTGSFQFTPKTVFAVETEEQAAIVRHKLQWGELHQLRIFLYLVIRDRAVAA